MTPYEQLKPTMDAGVEANLGDSIIYAREGEALPAEPNKIGFITFERPDIGIRGAEGMRGRWIMKIGKVQLDGESPSRTDRVTAPKLGGVMYRPAVDTLDSDGENWIVELQKR